MESDIESGDGELLLHVRLAKPGDLAGIVAVERVHREHEWLPGAEQDSYESWDEDLIVWFAGRPNAAILVATHDDKVVGSLMHIRYPGGLHVTHMMVDADYRRCGVGTLLFDTLTTELRQGDGPTFIHVQVEEKNDAAASFLLALGCRVAKAHRNIFASQECKLSFKWDLEEHRELESATEA